MYRPDHVPEHRLVVCGARGRLPARSIGGIAIAVGIGIELVGVGLIQNGRLVYTRRPRISQRLRKRPYRAPRRRRSSRPSPPATATSEAGSGTAVILNPASVPRVVPSREAMVSVMTSSDSVETESP